MIEKHPSKIHSFLNLFKYQNSIKSIYKKNSFSIPFLLVTAFVGSFIISCNTYPIREITQDDALEKELRADVDPLKELSEKELRSLEDPKKNNKKK